MRRLHRLFAPCLVSALLLAGAALAQELQKLAGTTPAQRAAVQTEFMRTRLGLSETQQPKIAALWIVFRLLHYGQVDGQTAGLLALLVLALACFFGGLHSGPVWLVVAGFLGAGIVVALELEAYLWLLLVLGMLLVGGLVFWRVRGRRA